MAAGSQGIDVGDAVLTFLGDTTQLDQAFDRVATKAETKMAEAADSVGQVGDATDQVASSMETRMAAAADKMAAAAEKMAASSSQHIGQVKTTVDEVSDSMAVGRSGAQRMGEVMTLAGTKARASMYEARGEGMLLGEMIGVRLPRHVISFLAELPGVGAALSSAFAATAVIFLLVKLGELIDKHMQMAAVLRHEADESEALAIKQRDLVEGLEAANLQLEDQIRKLEGRPAVNTLAIAMKDVKKSVDELLATYATDFEKMDGVIEKQ